MQQNKTHLSSPFLKQLLTVQITLQNTVTVNSCSLSWAKRKKKKIKKIQKPIVHQKDFSSPSVFRSGIDQLNLLLYRIHFKK